ITRAVLSKDSRLSIEACTVLSGEASQNAIAIELTRSTLSLSESVVRSDPMANYSVGVLGEDSVVEIDHSQFYLNARYGAIGIKTRGGQNRIEASRFAGQRADEFLYLINQEGGSGVFYNNTLVSGPTKDAAGVFLTRTQADWVNNTILVGEGSNTTYGFFVRSSDSVRLINNIVSGRKETLGTALFCVGALPSEIRSNCFYGWEVLLEQSAETRGAKSTSTLKLDDLNALDGNRKGGPIDGNIEESPYKSFTISKEEDYHLRPTSLCINAGVNAGLAPYNGPTVDMEGEKRPAPHIGIRPAYDIGADEYH
ncbi:MAG TPA: hypothetical protein VMX75_01300, partial [Spirochaetia bacterium]|nr:hypothetical protein [Spirochaetia bacterium]